MSRFTSVVAIAAAVLVAGCSADPGTGTSVVARDTVVVHDGADVTVRIIESTPDTVQRWAVRAAPVVDIGAGDVELYRVRGSYRLPEGRIVVADGGSSQLKFFDATGAPDTAVGGEGEGPGEFRNITLFDRLPGDSLFVWDLLLRRVTIYDETGARVRETLSEVPANVIGVFSDGSMLGRGFLGGEGGPPAGLQRLAAAVMRIAPDGASADSLGMVAGSEAFFSPFDGGFSVNPPPFQRTTETVVAGDRWYVGDSERAEIRASAPDGTPLMLVRWTDRGRDITPDEVERAKQEQLALGESEEYRARIERMYREVPLPERMPVFSKFQVARDGGIWVQRYRTAWDGGPAEWLVFDVDGSFVTRVLLPPALEPTDIGEDYVLGIERDELDVEHVRLYSLERTTGSDA